MAQEVLTRCGYRCDLCHAYKGNIEKNDQREILSKGWYDIFGIELEPEEIYCEGCISSDSDDIKLIDSGCKVRPCVIKKGYENCFQCDQCVCSTLEDRIVDYNDLTINQGIKINRSQRKNCVKPYENYDRLMALKEKNGVHSRMYNKLLEPTKIDMEKFMEDQSLIKLWHELLDYLDDHYDFTENIRYGGKNYGWEINYRRGSKPMLSIHPERNAFTVLVVLGKKQVEELESKIELLQRSTQQLVDKTKGYHDGLWLWKQVKTKEDLNDCLTLLHIKRKPKML